MIPFKEYIKNCLKLLSESLTKSLKIYLLSKKYFTSKPTKVPATSALKKLVPTLGDKKSL